MTPPMRPTRPGPRERRTTMRATETNDGLRVHAVAGTYVVLLGFDLPEADCDGLLGFSIHRSDETENEAGFLSGMKAFLETDPGFPPGSLYSTADHPVQSFQWADYTAKPGHDYTYTVTALKGTPANLIAHAVTAVEVDDREPGLRRARRLLQPRRGGLAVLRPALRRPGARRGGEPEGVRMALAWPQRGARGASALLRSRPRRAAHRGLRVQLRAVPRGGEGGPRRGRRRAHRLRRPPGRPEAEEHRRGRGARARRRQRPADAVEVVHLAQQVHRQAARRRSRSRSGPGARTSRRAGSTAIPTSPTWSRIPRSRRRTSTTGPSSRSIRRPPPSRRGSRRSRRCRRCRRRSGPRRSSARARTSTRSNWYAALATGATDGLFMTFAFGMNDLFKEVYRNGAARLRFALMEQKTRVDESRAREDGGRGADPGAAQPARRTSSPSAASSAPTPSTAGSRSA